MDDQELTRYSRQMILPDWGAEGQLALRQASVLIVGAGGLGSPAALYLTAAGLGSLHIVDHDRVELANLQRQILHDSDDQGRLKVDSAETKLRSLNPLVKVNTHALRLEPSNAAGLIQKADVVLDGSDNFATRYVVNAACVRAEKPLVTGSVICWQGQVTVLRTDQKDSPCYACLFPPDAAEEETPCAEAGILAPLPGIIGSIQALEAMKLIAGVGESLAGRLLTLNALTMNWSERRFGKDPECPICK